MSLTARFFRSLNRWFGWVLVFTLLLIALLTVTVRQLLPAISEYRPDIEAYLSERLKTQVSIGTIEASWEGRFPTLLLQDVKIADHRSRSIKEISAEQLILGINPISSLIRLQPVMSKVEVWSLHTELQLYAGQIEQKTAESDAAPASDPLAALWLQPHIFFYDTRFDVALPSGKQVSFTSSRLNIENSSSQHHFRGELLLEYLDKQSALTLMVESDGAALNPAQANFDFYLKLAGLDSEVLELARELLPVPPELTRFQLASELWGRWSDGRLSSVQGAMDMDLLQLEKPDLALQINDFSTDFVLLQPRPGDYQLQLNELAAVVNQAPLVLPGVVIDHQGGRLSAVALKGLQLVELDSWLQSQALVPDAVKTVLTKLQLVGGVNNLRLSWPASDAEFDISRFSLQSDLDNVKFAAAYGAPEMSGVTGRLELDNSDAGLVGRIDLQSQGLGLFFPDVFKKGWQYDVGRGVIHLSLADKILTLRSEMLELQKAGINAAGRWSLHLPLQRENQSELTLLIGLKGSDGSLAPELIPDHAVSPAIKRWVSKAIKKGHINQGGFMLRTGTRRIEDLQPPVVQLFLDIADANVAYQDGWPAVTGARASFLMRDGGFEVDVSKGRVLNSDLGYAWVYLPPGSQRLVVLADTSGDAADVQQALLHSPLIKDAGSELANWRLSGAAHTKLGLSIPLTAKPIVKVDLTSDLSAGRLQSDKRNLKLSGMVGRIGYKTGSGLYAKKIKGRFFGYPFSASISSSALKSGERIRTTLNSKVAMSQLHSWSGIDLLKLADGVQSYRAVLDICTSGDCSGLKVNSDLAATSLALLPPYDKKKGTAMPFELAADFGDRQRFRLALGNKLRAVLELQKERLNRGVLTLGGGGARLSDTQGLLIKGDLDRVNYGSLSTFLDASGLLTEKKSGQAASAMDALDVVVDLNIGEFEYEAFSLTGIHAQLEQNQGWQLRLSNVDSDALIKFPDTPQAPYKVELSELNLDRIMASKIEAESATDRKDIKAPEPGRLSNFDISIANLILKDKRWGSWSFKIRNSDQHTVIRDIQGQMDQLKAKGQLDWQPGLPTQSKLVLRIDAKNFGRSLQSAGFDKVLETDAFNADLKLSWPGAPWQYDLAASHGAARFKAEDGRLIEAGTTGFLRVFGILNLNAIGRRLRLDFADLFAKGVSFDRMTGDYLIEKGVARTKEPFILRGPSVDMAMTGELDLVAETVNKQMAVTLPVTDNIPLAAVLLGAPQVAGAAFLLDKLIGDKLKKEIATVSYQMKGDWSDPKVELIQGRPEKSSGK